MLKKILIVIAVVLFGLAVLIFFQPSDYRVSRSATMAASPARVFTMVNDFHNWDAWSPWAKLDPAMKTTFEGPPAGTGAVYGWSGNNDVGEGRMTITDSQPNERIRINLEFIRPFASTSTTDFVLKPVENGVTVDWTMTGQNNFIAKAFGLFMNMDKMIGADFEKGLAQMKSAAEAR